jgi:hypothetical protein
LKIVIISDDKTRSGSSSSKDEELDVSILDLLKSVIHVDEVSPPIEETVQAHERPPKSQLFIIILHNN